jgi:hypothetical protein
VSSQELEATIARAAEMNADAAAARSVIESKRPAAKSRFALKCEGCPTEDRCPACPDLPLVTPGLPGRDDDMGASRR